VASKKKSDGELSSKLSYFVLKVINLEVWLIDC